MVGQYLLSLALTILSLSSFSSYSDTNKWALIAESAPKITADNDYYRETREKITFTSFVRDGHKLGLVFKAITIEQFLFVLIT